MKVSELSKITGISEKELIEKLKKKGFEVKTKASRVSEEALKALNVKIDDYKSSKKAAKKTKAKVATKAKTTKKSTVKKKAVKKAKVEKKKKDVKPTKKIKKTKKPAEVEIAKELASAVSEPETKPASQVEKKKSEPQEVLEQTKSETVEDKPKKDTKSIELDFPVTLKDLAVKIQQKPSELIKKLLGAGQFVTINQALNEEDAQKIASDFGYTLKKAPTLEDSLIQKHKQDESRLSPRQPVVTFMGHVDHGKTSLLDAIRASKVVDREHGGITQHIGAYEVILPKGRITFLDTPGHEAFTAMRSRGANITDIVVLVVAADDGIMPQTEEAIDHALAAQVPIVVAINKIDMPQADIDKVKKQLNQRNLIPEDWGGKTITVGVSAKTGEGIDDLLEMILLEAEMLELKADYDKPASGVVVEAKISKGRGVVVTLLVQSGTLKMPQTVICGKSFGKIKAMFDDHGRKVEKVKPAVPVEVLGLNGVPKAGEQFFVVENEKEAKILATQRSEKAKAGELASAKRITLDDIAKQVQEGTAKELNIILKADVQGSLEAVKDSIEKLETKEVQVKIIHSAVGNINSSDVVLAEASKAIIIGFNVSTDNLAKEAAEKEGVDIRIYRIIYEAIKEIKMALEGLLEPKIQEKFLGRVLIRQVFKLSKHGIIAGCFVEKGQVNRNASVRIKRNGQEIYKGKISSLKRFKDDVRDVQEGYECGLSVSNFTDYMPGDVVEAFETERIVRKL